MATPLRLHDGPPPRREPDREGRTDPPPAPSHDEEPEPVTMPDPEAPPVRRPSPPRGIMAIGGELYSWTRAEIIG